MIHHKRTCQLNSAHQKIQERKILNTSFDQWLDLEALQNFGNVMQEVEKGQQSHLTKVIDYKCVHRLIDQQKSSQNLLFGSHSSQFSELIDSMKVKSEYHFVYY